MKAMKTLQVLFGVCFYLVSASYVDVLEQDCNELVSEFGRGMEAAPSFSVIAPEFSQEITEIEAVIKSQMSKSLRQVLSGLLKKVQDALEKSVDVAKDLMVEVTQLMDKLKTLKESWTDLGLFSKLRSILDRLLESSRNYSLIRVPLELDEKNLMENVKQNILERLNLKEIVDYVKAKLAKLGELGEALLEALQRPGAVEKLRALLQVLLPGVGQNYGIADIWQKVKDFFKGVGVKISDKFYLFADWLKDVSKRAWEQVSDKAAKLKEMAKTVSSKAGDMSKKVAEQALEFFREHKSEIGEAVWSMVKGALTAAIASAG